MNSDYSEDSLVEQPAIALFSELDWETANCFHEKFGENGTLGRETSNEVVLVPRLRTALLRLNHDLSTEAIALAIEELTRDMLLPKLISGEVDVEKIDIKMPGNGGA